MDKSLALRLKMPVSVLPCPLAVTAVDGKPLGIGRVEEISGPVFMHIDSHMERMHFFSLMLLSCQF